MLISSVLAPEALSETQLSDRLYQINLAAFLEGIISNGVILIDKDNILYTEICNKIESLKSFKNGNIICALFEEIVKKQRQKIIRFVKTNNDLNLNQKSFSLIDIAKEYEANCIIIDDPNTTSFLPLNGNNGLHVLPITSYFLSAPEIKRRSYLNRIPSLANLKNDEFGKIIADATRYSRWLRFFDKQIGKGTNLVGFRNGIQRVLQAWVGSAHFNNLTAEIFTIVDEGPYRAKDPAIAIACIESDLINPLIQQFNIPIRLNLKRDRKSLTHSRFLQSQSISIMFERGFDIVTNDGSLTPTFITIGGDFDSHLMEYRRLEDYI